MSIIIVWKVKNTLSHLSQKSSANLNASFVLISNGLFASSVHCSYYALFQHMTCLINEKMKISFEDILKNSKGSGSHDYVINNTVRFLNGKIIAIEPLAIEVEKTNIQKLRKKITDLKLLRIQSDYHNLEIDSQTSNKALNLSQEIITKLEQLVA